MNRIVYGEGGFDSGHPSGNKLEFFDMGNGTLTRWDEAGTVTTFRPLLPEEIADLIDPMPSVEDRVEALEAKSDQTQKLADVLVAKGVLSAGDVDVIKVDPVLGVVDPII